MINITSKDIEYILQNIKHKSINEIASFLNLTNIQVNEIIYRIEQQIDYDIDYIKSNAKKNYHILKSNDINKINDIIDWYNKRFIPQRSKYITTLDTTIFNALKNSNYPV